MARAEASLHVPTHFASQPLHKSRRIQFASQTMATYKQAHGLVTPHTIATFSNLAFNAPAQKAERTP